MRCSIKGVLISMSWKREDLGYLKQQLIRVIIGLIGMGIAFIIGTVKDVKALSVACFLIGIFIFFCLIRTITIINRINKNR